MVGEMKMGRPGRPGHLFSYSHPFPIPPSSLFFTFRNEEKVVQVGKVQRMVEEFGDKRSPKRSPLGCPENQGLTPDASDTIVR